MERFRQDAAELSASMQALALANKPTDTLIHRASVAAAQYLARAIRGRVKIILPGNIVITRDAIAHDQK